MWSSQKPWALSTSSSSFLIPGSKWKSRWYNFHNRSWALSLLTSPLQALPQHTYLVWLLFIKALLLEYEHSESRDSCLFHSLQCLKCLTHSTCSVNTCSVDKGIEGPVSYTLVQKTQCVTHQMSQVCGHHILLRWGKSGSETWSELSEVSSEMNSLLHNIRYSEALPRRRNRKCHWVIMIRIIIVKVYQALVRVRGCSKYYVH